MYDDVPALPQIPAGMRGDKVFHSIPYLLGKVKKAAVARWKTVEKDIAFTKEMCYNENSFEWIADDPYCTENMKLVQ